MTKSKLALVLGIRPDVIRASLLINSLRDQIGNDFVLIWSGQHYSDNLKDVFFRELGVDKPEVELDIKGQTDAELVSNLLPKLSTALEEIDPTACVFLGDTNTVTGTLAAAQLNIPIVHIEGCMRSYDWRMPEEKYRKTADHLSDLIYAYLPEYKEQGIAEGIPSPNIEVTGNPIVDVLEKYFISGKLRMNSKKLDSLFKDKYGLKQANKYVLMTSHRRENVQNYSALMRILTLANASPFPVIFPAGYRTIRMIKEFNLQIPANIVLVEPVGYLEILELLNSAEFVMTDSGTLVEEAAILGTPCIQMRKSTERPQVYEWNSAIKFDPSDENDAKAPIGRIQEIQRGSWTHGFGDGFASDRIVQSLLLNLHNQTFDRHDPKLWSPYSERSYQ